VSKPLQIEKSKNIDLLQSDADTDSLGSIPHELSPGLFDRMAYDFGCFASHKPFYSFNHGDYLDNPSN
jgi:hypothetical protein